MSLRLLYEIGKNLARRKTDPSTTLEKMQQGKTFEVVGTADKHGLAKTGTPRTQWSELNAEQTEAVDILTKAFLKGNPNISPATAKLYAREQIANLRYYQSEAYKNHLKKLGFSDKEVASNINQHITNIINKQGPAKVYLGHGDVPSTPRKHLKKNTGGPVELIKLNHGY